MDVPLNIKIKQVIDRVDQCTGTANCPNSVESVELTVEDTEHFFVQGKGCCFTCTKIVGKNGFIPSDSNKDYAIKKLGKLEDLLKDYDNVTARVVCKVYKAFHKVEVTIPAKNIILRAEVTEADIYAAIEEGEES